MESGGRGGALQGGEGSWSLSINVFFYYIKMVLVVLKLKANNIGIYKS